MTATAAKMTAVAETDRSIESQDAGLHRFIPPALVRWPDLGTKREHFGAVLFLDVAGFTRLAETLAAQGPEGAELLDRTIAAYFDALLDIVDRYGGHAIKIAGDALTILFLEDQDKLDHAALRAASCAAQLAQAHDLGGEHELAHKVGVGCGRLFAGVVGDPTTRQELVYGGPALNQAVAAEKEATAGEVWVSAEVAHRAELATWAGGDAPHQMVIEDREALKFAPLAVASPPLAPAAFERWRSVVPRAVLEHAEGASVEYLCRHQSITVLFAGVPGLLLDRPESIDVVAEHYAAMSEIISNHGGFLSEFEAGDKGSKLIILFGAPAVLESPTTQAIRCAYALQERARDMGLVPDQRIGIATGRLYVGRIGCRSIVKYSALGDRMNLAARLMSKAEAWEVLTESRTVQRTQRYATWSDGRAVQVKGKVEPIMVHHLEGLQNSASGGRRGLGMVGRGSEMNRVGEALSHLRHGRGTVVDIVGGAGVGKTRLATAIWRMASDRHMIDCQIWRGATAERNSAPLSAWAGLLSEIIAPEGDSSPEVRRIAFKAWLTQLPADQRPGGTLLAPLMGVDYPVDPILDGLEAPRRLTLQREALVEAIGHGCSGNQPRVLIIDEAESLDQPSISVLSDLGAVIGQIGLVVIVLRRPHEGQSDPYEEIGSAANHQRVELEPLDRAAADRLVQNRLGCSRLDQELANLLYTHSQGNPLLLEAWVDTLSDSDRIGNAEGTAFLTGDAAVELPDRFEALVLVRLERLPPDAQTTMRIASIIDIPFTPQDVAELHPAARSTEAVIHHLAQGAEIGLLYYDRDNKPYMYFSRREVRDAIHNTLPFTLRRQLHGGRIDQLTRGEQSLSEGDLAILLASHYCYVEDPAAQLNHFYQASQVCANRYAHRESVVWAQRTAKAAESVGDLQRLTDAYATLQHALSLLGELEERAKAVDALQAAAERADDVKLVVEAMAMRARMAQRDGKIDEALEEIGRARAIAQEKGDAASEALCLTTAASLNTEAGRLQAGITIAKEALDYLEATDMGLRSQVLANIGFALNGLGRSSEAHGYLQQALTASRKSGNLWYQSVLEGNMGIELWGMGRPEEGHARLQRALDLKKKVGDKREQALGLLNMGFSNLRLGRPDLAQRDTEEAMRIFVRLGYHRGILFCLLNLGEASFFNQDYDTCRAQLKRLETELAEHPHEAIELEGLLIRGELSLVEENFSRAEEAFKGALRIAQSQSVLGKEAHAQEGLAVAVMKQRRLTEGRAYVERAIEIMESLPEPPAFPQRMMWRAASIAKAQGDILAHKRFAARARELLEDELSKLNEEETRERVRHASQWNQEIMA